MGKTEIFLVLLRTLGYATITLITNHNIILTSSQTIAYIVPYIILADPRIFFTHINLLINRKLSYLIIMLNSLKGHNNPLILQKISQYHQKICTTLIKFQNCLKIQILLVFFKAFQDVLAAFYAVMSGIGNFQIVFCGIMAIFELFLLIYPVEKNLEKVSRPTSI